MLEVRTKKFSAIEFEGENGEAIRIEEGMTVEATMEETGEVVIGTMTKITAKELFIHVGDEDFNRVFTHDALINIRDVNDIKEER